jgi:hypothetical protein
MQNLDEVFMEVFLKTASELTTQPSEMSAVEKLAAVTPAFKEAFMKRHLASMEANKHRPVHAGRYDHPAPKAGGRFSGLGQKAKYQGKLWSKQSTGRKLGQGALAAAAVGAAGYGAYKGIKAWKNRKNKK